MAENKNMELKDEMLNSAVGGETIVYDDPLFEIGDRVEEKDFPGEAGTVLSRRTQYFEGSEQYHWMYKIKWDSGVTLEKDEIFLQRVRG